LAVRNAAEARRLLDAKVPWASGKVPEWQTQPPKNGQATHVGSTPPSPPKNMAENGRK
jgi:hypothetical protein